MRPAIPILVALMIFLSASTAWAVTLETRQAESASALPAGTRLYDDPQIATVGNDAVLYENNATINYQFDAPSGSTVEQVTVRSRGSASNKGGNIDIDIVVDGVPQSPQRIPTSATSYQNRVWAVNLPSGRHTIGVRATGLNGQDKIFTDYLRLSGSEGPTLPPPPPPPGDTNCTKVISPVANIANAVNNSAPDGTVLCLHGGIYDQDLRITNNLITIKSYPGEVAEMRGHTEVNASDVTLDGMKFRGQYGPTTTGSAVDPIKTWPAVEINTVRVTVKNSPLIENQSPTDPKNHSGQAISVGSASDSYKILNNFFGPFGEDAGGNNHQHAIYTGSDNGQIRDNIFSPDWPNGDRCIQLYRGPDNTLIEGNIFDHCNDVAIHYSGRGQEATTDTESHGNVIAYTREEYNVNTFTGQVDSPSLFHGNSVHDNCAMTTLALNDAPDGSGIQANMPGMSTYGNIVANPQFDSQHRIKSGTACAAKYTGPAQNTY